MRAEHDGSDELEARRKLGSSTRVQEDMRHVWRPAFLDTLSRDARFTWRTWRRNPAFSLAALLTLALGLGALIALFSVCDRILFRSLPYQDSRATGVELGAPL